MNKYNNMLKILSTAKNYAGKIYVCFFDFLIGLSTLKDGCLKHPGPGVVAVQACLNGCCH